MKKSTFVLFTLSVFLLSCSSPKEVTGPGHPVTLPESRGEVAPQQPAQQPAPTQNIQYDR